MATINALNNASAPFTVTVGDLTVTAGNSVLTAGDVSIGNVAAGTTAPFTTFKKSRAGSTITTGDYLGEINFQGHDGSNYIVSSRIVSQSTGTIATNRVGSNLLFYTHPNSTSAATNTMALYSDGTLSVLNSSGTYGITSREKPILTKIAPGGTSVGGIHWYSDYSRTYLLVHGGDGQFDSYDNCLVWGNFDSRIPGNNYVIAIGNAIGQSGSGIERCIVMGQRACQNPYGAVTYSTIIGNSAGQYASSTSSCFYGETAGRYCRGANTVAIGNAALTSTVTTAGNVAIGNSSLTTITSGSGTAVGFESLKAATTGTNNTAVGYQAGNTITTGSDNCFFGNLAGSSCTVDDHSNIIIGNTGTAGDVHKIRIGTQGTSAGQQSSAYVAGIYGVTPGGTINVALVDSNGQLGSIAALPPARGGRNSVSESTTSNSVQMAVNTTYIATSTDGATLVTYTLPATAAVGDQVKVIGKSTAFWKVAQNATDTIHYAAATSTPGATGYATTAQTWASATFTCITASSIWVITDVAGTVTLS